MINISSMKVASRAFVIAAVVLLGVPALTHAAVLTRQLDVDMSGSDVSALQTYLALDASIYPQGRVTGYFGPLTKIAVANFQSRNGLASVGRVGPLTLALLNIKMAGGTGIIGNVPSPAPVISLVGISTGQSAASFSWGTNEAATGIVYFSASPLMLTEHPNSVDVLNGSAAMTDMVYRTYQNIAVTGLSANTTYYYMVYTTDQEGNVSVSWPATFRTTN